MLLTLLLACSEPSPTLSCDDGSYSFNVRDVGPGNTYTVDWAAVSTDDDIGEVFDTTADVYVSVTRLLVTAEEFSAALCAGENTTELQGSSVSAESPDVGVPQAEADIPGNNGDSLVATVNYDDGGFVTFGMFRVGASGDTVLVLDDQSFTR